MKFCKYSKFMRESNNPNKDMQKKDKDNRLSDHGIYIKEDDQDWGSSGMNNIQQEESEKNY